MKTEIRQAILNGAYAVTQNGIKLRLFDTCTSKGKNYHVFVGIRNEGFHVFWLDDSFTFRGGDDRIIGLWEDEPEPFNLERALSGEPLINKKMGLKCWLHKSRKSDGYFIEFEDGGIIRSSENSLYTKFETWKESVKPSADNLPKPIRDFGDLEEVWYIELNYFNDIYQPVRQIKNKSWEGWQYARLNNGCYYATKDDCQRVCDWLIGR